MAGDTVHQAAVVLGSKGGKKGGPARARALGRERRREIARMGAIKKNAKYGRRGGR
jgi:hypothetical protein